MSKTKLPERIKFTNKNGKEFNLKLKNNPTRRTRKGTKLA